MNFRTFCFLTLGLFIVSREIQSAAPVNIYGEGKIRAIPIALSGYTGEAAAVLKFDLEVAGFVVSTADAADFILAGKNDGGQVEGRLQNANTKATLLAKAYTGETTRSQAHALADEVVQAAIPGQLGIARTKIVFKHERSRGVSEIFISDYDGHNAKPVSQDNALVAAPAWLPKQWHLFYTSYKSGFPWIYSHNLTTGERRPFAKFPGLNAGAAISPDGTKVAMILSKAGSPDVWAADINGGNLKRLTQTREDESSPCWSPDGTKLCFASRVNERRGLYIMPAAGGPMVRLNTGDEPNPSEPDWSPDGKRIVFTSQSGNNFSICTISPQGGPVEKHFAGEDPSWAPNSRTVIFTRRSGDKAILSLLDVPTVRVKDTAQIAGSRSQPSWSK
jgi:TolB protein